MKLRKLFGKLFISIIIIGTVFSLLPSMSKAKCSIFLLGINEQNNSDYESIKKIILENKYETYSKLEQLDSMQLNLLQRYHDSIKTVGILSRKPLKLKEIYAKKGEMIQTDNVIEGKPLQRFVEAYWSNEIFILCTNAGGFGESTFFEFFEVQENNLHELESVSILSGKSIFDLALYLKFDDELSKYNAPIESGF